MSSTPAGTRGLDECGICAFGVVQATLAAMPALRKKPGPLLGEPIPASLLRHADEQTVAGLAAVAHAIHDCGLRNESFADWGVLGAPRFPGRLGAAEAIQGFLREGPLGVSPHVISQRATHSLSGAISLAFQMRGPNFGVGGARGAMGEGLMAALALMGEESMPGLWLVLTEWGPEPVFEGPGPSAEQALCHAAALALVPAPADSINLRLKLIPTPSADTVSDSLPTVASLIAFLKGMSGPEVTQPWRWPLSWGSVLELSSGGGKPSQCLVPCN